MEFLPPAVMRTSGAEFSRQSWHVVAPVGVTVADLLRPTFWTHQAMKLKVDDVLDVVAADGSFDVTLRAVAKSDDKPVTMRLLRLWEPTATVKELPKEAALEVSFAPAPGHRWRVIRKSDGVILKKDFPSRVDAEAWADETMRQAA